MAAMPARPFMYITTYHSPIIEYAKRKGSYASSTCFNYEELRDRN